MNNIPKLTLDNNCIINLFDFNAETPTSVEPLSEIIKFSLSNKVDIAITTRVEADLENDRDDARRSEMMRKLNMFPVVGTLARWGKLRGIGLLRRILCCKMQSKNMKRRIGRK